MDDRGKILAAIERALRDSPFVWDHWHDQRLDDNDYQELAGEISREIHAALTHSSEGSGGTQTVRTLEDAS